MFRDDEQANRALCALMQTIEGTRDLWTPDGPSATALQYLDRRGGPLSSGERCLLLAAFDFWNGHGKINLHALVHTLRGRPAEALYSLMLAFDRGSDEVDTWIMTQQLDSGDGGNTMRAEHDAPRTSKRAASAMKQA